MSGETIDVEAAARSMKTIIRNLKYPEPCCRCGACCVFETCPTATNLFGLPKNAPCPELIFDGDVAICKPYVVLKDLVDDEDLNPVFGIGAGCCIKARCFKDGVEYDFASLPPETKISVVRGMRDNEVQTGRIPAVDQGNQMGNFSATNSGRKKSPPKGERQGPSV